MPVDKFSAEVIGQLNQALEEVKSKQAEETKEILAFIEDMHNKAKIKHGDGNYYFWWDGQSPSQIQEQLQIDSSYLVA